jgi:hypothetical protein
MSTPSIRNPRGIAYAAAIVSIALTISSCGSTEASAPAVPMEAVMHAVHDYGRDHKDATSSISASSGDASTSLLSVNSEPAETMEHYEANINSLLAHGDFQTLEKIATQNRGEKARLAGGVWKTYAFFDAVATPLHGDAEDSDYERQIATVQKWVAANPKSASARLALANAYLGYAFYARGTEYAKSVSSEDWSDFRRRAGLAKRALLEAAQLEERDREWFDAMLQVAHDEEWSRAQYREVFDEAAGFEPGYYHYYRRYALDLLPQWYGKPGDVQAFAADVAAHHPEPDSSILYFEIVSTLACYCQESMEALPATSWPKVKQGYADIQRLYGTSNLKANRYALFAVAAQDKSAAVGAIAAITSPEMEVWMNEQTFEGVRGWVNAP